MIARMMKSFLPICLAAVLLLAAGPAPATSQTMDIPADMAPEPAPVDAIVVIKSERTLYLLDRHHNVIKSYRVALGGNPVGDKEEEGDSKTPEGRYYVENRNPNSHYYLSLKVSYPNASDKERARRRKVSPGGNIFIHGQPNGKAWMWWKYSPKYDWTDGCIGMTDRDVKEVWDLVADKTPIIIRP